MNRPDIIAERVKKARQARELDRETLAELAPCSVRTVGAIERGESRLSIEMAVAFAKVLHVRVPWLLDLEE